MTDKPDFAVAITLLQSELSSNWGIGKKWTDSMESAIAALCAYPALVKERDDGEAANKELSGIAIELKEALGQVKTYDYDKLKAENAALKAKVDDCREAFKAACLNLKIYQDKQATLKAELDAARPLLEAVKKWDGRFEWQSAKSIVLAADDYRAKTEGKERANGQTID